jgi:hypothetical protein
VDPWGTVLAEAGTEAGITWCDVDPSLVDRAREEFPVLADRRLDLTFAQQHGTAGAPTGSRHLVASPEGARERTPDPHLNDRF